MSADRPTGDPALALLALQSSRDPVIVLSQIEHSRGRLLARCDRQVPLPGQLGCGRDRVRALLGLGLVVFVGQPVHQDISHLGLLVRQRAAEYDQMPAFADLDRPEL